MRIEVSCMMTISLSLSCSGPSHFRLVQVIPGRAIWLCKSHTGHDQRQLSRCSTGMDRVTSEGYRRQEQLCSDTVFTSDSPLDTSVTTSESQWHVVRLTEGPPDNFTANPGTGTQGNAQFPWASRATGTTIKKDQYWDGMSSGEQTCQHPPRECPCPLGALTQLTGDVGGGPATPHHRAALQPAWLTRTICSGLRGRASGQHIFCTNTRVAFVSHDCLWLACRFLSHVIAGNVCSEETKDKTMQSLSERGEMLETPFDSCAVCSEATVFAVSFATYSP